MISFERIHNLPVSWGEGGGGGGGGVHGKLFAVAFSIFAKLYSPKCDVSFQESG